MHMQWKRWNQGLRNANLFPLAIALTLSALHLPSCQPPENELRFETIDQDDGHYWGTHQGKEPKLLVLTDSEEIAALYRVVSQPATRVNTDSGETWQYPDWRLQGMDWEAFFVVIAFQGRRQTTGYSVTIQRITQQRQSINIRAQFDAPEPLHTVHELVTSPLHVVKVQKSDELRGKEFQFSLVVNGRIVAETSHLLP